LAKIEKTRAEQRSLIRKVWIVRHRHNDVVMHFMVTVMGVVVVVVVMVGSLALSRPLWALTTNDT
jgi:hypothetical protein